MGKLHPLKQNLTELLWRIDVEGFTSQVIDFLLQGHNFPFQLLTIKL